MPSTVALLRIDALAVGYGRGKTAVRAASLENSLGDDGEAFGHLSHNLAQERLPIALTTSAAAQAAVTFTVDYLRQQSCSAPSGPAW